MTPPRVRMEGLLGQALAANHGGRLSRFIVDENSPAIALFDPRRADANNEGDWYGEHAGKWMYAAAKAAWRTGDAGLAARVRAVADYLVSVQRDDGYLGTYAVKRRFTVKPGPPQPTWDGAPAKRSWDVWTHSYLILGLLEAQRHEPGARYLQAAVRIGDLCLRVLGDGVDFTHLGNHHGLSATVMLDAAVELHFATREPRFLDLARRILAQAEARPELHLLSKALAGVDAADIATGKSYQLCWNLVGLAKLHRATGDPRLLTAVMKLWESIRDQHLTLGGGPWGGVAHRSREVFNAPGAFSPAGYVETCSTHAWIQLNRELLAITREARFADEIERAAYNDLLGAQGANGEDWCYYSFPNGRRVFTTYWRCCKSSGAMALEDLPELAYSVDPAAIRVNLYGPSEAELVCEPVGRVRLTQTTGYPADGDIRIEVRPERAARFAMHLRIPAWAREATVAVNGAAHAARPEPGSYLAIERDWKVGDEIALQFPMAPVMHRRSNRNVQESVAPDGAPVSQEVLRLEYAAITRGPLVYATGLIDGFKIEETVRLEGAEIEEAGRAAGFEGPALRLRLGYREPLTLLPYYEAGGRSDGAWRITWLSLAPGDASPPPAIPRGKP